jgi:hypothetical protein
LRLKHEGNEYFMFTVGSVCLVNRFQLGRKCFADDEKVETEVMNWLTQQSRDICAADFDTLVKRWDQCVKVGGEYVEK